MFVVFGVVCDVWHLACVMSSVWSECCLCFEFCMWCVMCVVGGVCGVMSVVVGVARGVQCVFCVFIVCVGELCGVR